MCTEYLVDVISHFGQYRLLAQALSKKVRLSPRSGL